MNKCNFTFKHYREIINLAKKKGYVFSDFFKKPTPSKKRIYMRHDVDVSLDNALRMAEIENEERIKSTYFILIDSPFYNILNEENRKIVKKIREFGHDVGMHYDERIKPGEQIVSNIMKQYKFLTLVALPIKKIVSFHRPTKKVLGKFFLQFISACEPDFFIRTKYISDSNRKWREGCLCQFFKKSSYTNFQVLIHPIWWNDKNLSYADLYQKIKKQKTREIKEGLISNINAYKNLFKNL